MSSVVDDTLEAAIKQVLARGEALAAAAMLLEAGGKHAKASELIRQSTGIRLAATLLRDDKARYTIRRQVRMQHPDVDASMIYSPPSQTEETPCLTTPLKR